MSLVAYALRTALRQALLNRTHAEDRVYDSLITSLAQLAEEGPRPLIIVSTDDDEGALTRGNRKLTLSKRNLQIIVEMTLAGAVEVEAGVASVEIPHTDEGLEKALDFMGRRVWRAMVDPASAWADLFARFLGSPKQFYSRRGADDSKGVLFAARQLVIVCDPIEEPDYGIAPEAGTPWADLVELMRETPGLEIEADVLATEIVGAPLQAWQVEAARLGLARAALLAVGHGPLEGLDVTPPATRFTIHAEGRAPVVVDGEGAL